ncbi:endolytic transglycosylase MltG [Nocardiopsis sp. NPDC006938]|uniref:endolytic transglycosylase MltG n=1 Tax=Nocardiopsis sp. NPDC006938 TaxID=3364337 RepID=UPI0036CEBE15
MTDRDDYPDPRRGRADREGGYDYDPLSDPLPAQPPSRGRRARPEPGPNTRAEEPGTGEFGHTGGYGGQAPGRPAPGRRRRAEPPADETPWNDDPHAAPPRRFGAADALRGGRAARGGQAPGRPAQASPPDTGGQQRPGPDATQDALAALANLGGAQSASRAPAGAPADAEPPAREQPPRRARRARAEQPEEPRSAFWGDDAEESDAFGAEPPVEEPQSRRGRRRRAQETPPEPQGDTGAFRSREPEPEEPAGRRGRRRSRRAEPEPEDTGAFRAPEPEPEPEPEAPSGRRGRRRSRVEEEPEDTGAFATAPVTDTGAFAELSHLDEDEEHLTDTGSFLAQEPEDEEPKGRRGRRRSRRGRRAEPEPEPEVEEEPEEDLYEEDSLEDIAATYGNSRANRKRAKRAKAAQAARLNKGKPKKRRKSKGMVVVLALVLLLVVAGGGYGVARAYVFPPDFSGDGEGEVVFRIAEGESGTAIAQSLVDQGVVASVRAFTNALGSEGLVPGTYSLAEGMSGESAVAALFDPDNRLGGRVTIREGLRSEQVLQMVSEELGVPLEELEEAYGSTEDLNLPDYATEGPAGYLFPSTYRFEPDTDALSMLRTMITQHKRVAEESNLEERAADIGYDANEIMAIASIVQAESGRSEDMPKISRVVHNRLDIDMPLQMDSTCFFAIGEYGIALNNDQLARCRDDTSGFDTYFSTGLIPGPFVAPGQEAIEAALDPEEGEWLYFVATDPDNGVTEFAETHAEFEVLKERFQETWGGGSGGDGE